MTPLRAALLASLLLCTAAFADAPRTDVAKSSDQMAAALTQRGIANFAPLASNAAEDGRARNRRVKRVLQ